MFFSPNEYQVFYYMQVLFKYLSALRLFFDSWTEPLQNKNNEYKIK